MHVYTYTSRDTSGKFPPNPVAQPNDRVVNDPADWHVPVDCCTALHSELRLQTVILKCSYSMGMDNQSITEKQLWYYKYYSSLAG